MRIHDSEVRFNSNFLNILALRIFKRLFLDIQTFYCTVLIYSKAQVKNIIQPLPFSAIEIGVKGIIV